MFTPGQKVKFSKKYLKPYSKEDPFAGGLFKMRGTVIRTEKKGVRVDWGDGIYALYAPEDLEVIKYRAFLLR